MAAGALVALCGGIKLPLLLLCAYFAVRRRWKALAGAALTLGTLAGGSWLLFGPDLHALWLERAVIPFIGRPLASYNVECVDGFLARLFAPDNLLNFDPLDLGAPFHILRGIARLVLLGVLLARHLHARESEP